MGKWLTQRKSVIDGTEKKLKTLVPIKPGQSGNPKGRPKCARNKLSEACIQDFYEFWQVNGPDVFRITMVKRPGDFKLFITHFIQ